MLGNIFSALSCFGGSYLMYYIIHYLENKRPGFKTVLDCQHVQLLRYWIMESMASYTLATMYEFQVTSWVLSWIVGYGWYLIFVLTGLHQLICLFSRILLIFYQHTVQEIPDRKIMKNTRYVWFCKIVGIQKLYIGCVINISFCTDLWRL